MKDTSIAAFPVCIDDRDFNTGMTLRDYFAGQALAGLLNSFASTIETSAEVVAFASYQLADAMLAKREIEQSANAEK